MSIKPLALSFGEVQRSPAAASKVLPRGEQLWIAVHLPALALQAVEPLANDARPGILRKDRRPTVVVESSSGRLRVVALNDAARARGVHHGLDLNAAFAFSGALRVLERSHLAEQSLLEAAAAICQRFTPSVSLEPPESVLLEVRASLALFGGIEGLKAALGEALARRMSDFCVAVAPTPLAALWLARGGGGGAASEETLSSQLGRLPLRVTRWPDAVLNLLAGMGIATIAECLRLPRGGFARRVGKAYLEELDKSLGKRPDLRAAFAAPQHLELEIELLDESTSVPVFVDAVTRMVEHLACELRLRQAQIGKLQIMFKHMRLAPTVHGVELLDSTGYGPRLLELLCDKLERIVLPAPATALRLSAGPLEPAVVHAGRLFKGEGQTDGEAGVRLVERLRGRLGESAVHGLASAADHRPERAWAKTVTPGMLEPSRRRARAPQGSVLGECLQSPAHGGSVERPLWLASAPEPLRCVAGHPHLGGRLRMLEGPERIESGWWDGQGIARDYFVAVGPSGERLWVFRDRADRRWYLHGRFG